MYHAKKIGVFISHLFGEYQKNVCQGIIDRALEYGYIVEIFSTADGENVGNYGIGEGSILMVPSYSEFHGVIFASGTYPSRELREEIGRTLAKRCTCPIIEINQDSDHYPVITLENNRTTAELVGHLAEVHHYRRICYLGCGPEESFSALRLAAYQEEMAKQKLPVGGHDTWISDYSEESIEAALSHYLAVGKPDAIVCYNDRLALLLMTILLARGYRLPEDIAITGCDNLEGGQNVVPRLTTVSFPIYELGVTAIEQLIKLLHLQQIPHATAVSAKLIPGASCGCRIDRQPNAIFYEKKLTGRIERLESSILGSMRMSANFQGMTDLDTGIELLEDYIKELGCSEFYLCLYSDWDRVSGHIRKLTSTQEESPDSDIILLKLAVRDGKRLPECSFTKKFILPDYIYKSSNSAYIYTPLFFGEKAFGYTAIAYEDNRIDYHFQLVHWHLNINQMLKGIYDAKKTGILVNRLEDLYIKDELTGLYNQNGVKQLEQSLLEHAASSGAPLCCFTFRLDGYQAINEAYGPQEGDFALRVVAHTLENSTCPEDLCARIGSDEFCLFACGYTDKTAASLIEAVKKYLDHYNQLNSKSYPIRVNCGFAIAGKNGIGSPHPLDDLYHEARRNSLSKKAVAHL